MLRVLKARPVFRARWGQPAQADLQVRLEHRASLDLSVRSARRVQPGLLVSQARREFKACLEQRVLRALPVLWVPRDHPAF